MPEGHGYASELHKWQERPKVWVSFMNHPYINFSIYAWGPPICFRVAQMAEPKVQVYPLRNLPHISFKEIRLSLLTLNPLPSYKRSKSNAPDGYTRSGSYSFIINTRGNLLLIPNARTYYKKEADSSSLIWKGPRMVRLVGVLLLWVKKASYQAEFPNINLTRDHLARNRWRHLTTSQKSAEAVRKCN